MVMETSARREYLKATNDNTTIPCMGRGTLSTSMDYWWMAIPLFLHSLSAGVFGIGVIEFTASQAPYSMRGLIMGAAYCMLTLCVALGVGISIPFTRQLARGSSAVGSGMPCCFWWLKCWLASCLLPCRSGTRRGRGKMYCQMNTSLLRDTMTETADFMPFFTYLLVI